jgi:hypothetical protein
MKRFFTAIFIIYSLFLTACPKDSAVRKAAKASFELSGISVDVINATSKAFDAGIIGLAAKDRLAAAEGRIASGGKHFNEILSGYMTSTAGTLTVDQTVILNKIFSDEVVTPFLAILQELSVISLNQVAYLRTAIAALRTAILVISGTFADAGFPQSEWRMNYAG